jgi:hypothetical protein
MKRHSGQLRSGRLRARHWPKLFIIVIPPFPFTFTFLDLLSPCFNRQSCCVGRPFALLRVMARPCAAQGALQLQRRPRPMMLSPTARIRTMSKRCTVIGEKTQSPFMPLGTRTSPEWTRGYLLIRLSNLLRLSCPRQLVEPQP